MKARYIILGTALLAQLCLVLWPYIPGLSSLLPGQPTSREQLEWQIQVIGTGFGILTICVAGIFLSQERENDDFRDFLRKALPVTMIAQIRDDEFYTDFLYAATKAKHTVNIMYLAPRPPDHTKDKARLQYYCDLVNLIRSKKEVRFNRIMRHTTETKRWIENLIRELQNCPNASVAIIKESDTEEMPLSLSTQIIDNNKVWFVAVAGHERQGPYRDLFLENEKLAEAMQLYFDRLWTRGKLLLDVGQITPEGQKYLTPKGIPGL
jgi:hypothetical protein